MPVLFSDSTPFQSTSSARRTTLPLFRFYLQKLISIHVLREEDDFCRTTGKLLKVYFNPRPPRGGRPDIFSVIQYFSDFNPRPPRGGRRCDWWLCSAYAGFQSTSSARRTTKEECGYTPSYVISIHVLREEDDLLRLLPSLLTLQFQSTSSARRTTQSAKSNRR